MSATPEQVEVAHTKLWEQPCQAIPYNANPNASTVCNNHWWAKWTDRGCPESVWIADTIADAT